MRQPATESIALINGRLVLPGRVSDHEALIISDGVIVDVVDEAVLDPAVAVLDVGGRIVTAGLIDLHAHGGQGFNFGDGKEESLAAILGHYARCGITSVQPTLGSAPIESMTRSLDVIRSWVESPGDGCQVIGAHLEGPYFSHQQRGAHNPEHLRRPDDGSAGQLLAYADIISMMSIAPELPGALELIGEVVTAGIVAAAGHSDGREADLWAAAEAGVTHIIHLWSGQSMTIREGPWRRPGMVEASLASTGLTAEIIADDRHLPRTLMALAYRCLGPRLCVVSDASSGAGLPEGSTFGANGVDRVVRDGVGMLPDETAFAGSTTLVNQMLPILRDVVGIPLHEAVAMATTTPARVVGLGDHKGSLEAGKDADIAVFDENFTAWRTMIAGRWC